MTYEQLRSIVLSFWGRYGASWILKALVAYFGYSAATGGDTARSYAEFVGALLAFALDYWHSHSTMQNAINTTPPVPPLTPPNNGLTVKPPTGENK